jgi:uncharacterized membrane protein
MRILGHPVHVMVIHFPIALWPAHWMLHVFAAALPQPAVGLIAFWLLVVATGLAWLAALAGAVDLFELLGTADAPTRRRAWWHAGVNGTATAAFTGLTLLEYASYPQIRHGSLFLVAEAVVLAVLTVGNYFGGELVWRAPPSQPSS